MTRNRLFLILAIGALVAAFFALGLDQYLSLESFQRRQQELDAFVHANLAASITIFFLVYTLVTAL